MRRAAELSQEEFGFESELDRTHISVLERGLRQPTLVTLFLLTKTLNCKASEIIARVEEES